MDSLPGAMDESGRAYHRRMTEQKIQAFADSAMLKIMQFAVTAIAVPLIAWGGAKVLDRLDKVEAAIGDSSTNRATTELRMLNLEQMSKEREASLRLLDQKVQLNDYKIETLLRNGQLPPKR